MSRERRDVEADLENDYPHEHRLAAHKLDIRY